MTSIHKWQKESRDLLAKLIEKHLKDEFDDEKSSKIKSIMDKIQKDLDLFSVKRVLFRHDIIFRGNNKVNITKNDPNIP